MLVLSVLLLIRMSPSTLRSIYKLFIDVVCFIHTHSLRSYGFIGKVSEWVYFWWAKPLLNQIGSYLVDVDVNTFDCASRFSHYIVNIIYTFLCGSVSLSLSSCARELIYSLNNSFLLSPSLALLLCLSSIQWFHRQSPVYAAICLHVYKVDWFVNSICILYSSIHYVFIGNEFAFCTHLSQPKPRSRYAHTHK